VWSELGNKELPNLIDRDLKIVSKPTIARFKK
jgi:hypothetical protein